MAIKIFLCLLLGLVCIEARDYRRAQLTNKLCSLKPETGHCRGAFPRYYYNTATGTCERFIWGGCGGNDNRFEDKMDCVKTCAPQCFLKPESGLCLALFPRYYYNPSTQTCEEFIYGGCGGNQNNFDKKSDCLKTCAPDCHQEPDSGLCKAYMPHYFYNSTSKICELFIYGGCGGNRNRFQTKTECIGQCASHCFLKPETGPCEALIPRYFYNSTSGRCEKFTYGGCQGNGNNFETESECQNACSSRCYQKPEVGPCDAAFRRYFYNATSGACETFTYGGCDGNDNNFETEEECSNACRAL